jgi:hypothetical protein
MKFLFATQNEEEQIKGTSQLKSTRAFFAVASPTLHSIQENTSCQQKDRTDLSG